MNFPMSAADLPFFDVDGVRVPRFLYGTAWKEDQSQRLTELALAQGFRGIDTANQRKHYHEAAVGRAVVAAISSGQLSREQLFLQTKYTSLGGQDHRLPYDPAAPVARQVEQSLASSLQHFEVQQIDSFVLHGPTLRVGLAPADWQAWRAMETAQQTGLTRLLGVSNVSLEQLQALTADAHVRPHFVQNRCYAVDGWDRKVRAFCREQGMIYQGFSLLTANFKVLGHADTIRLARKYGRTVCQIVFRFALDVGMLPLTGTSDAANMQADLAVLDFQLTPAEVSTMESLAEW